MHSSLPLTHMETPTPPSPSGRGVKARGPQFLEPFTAVNRTWESPMWLSPRHAHTYKLFAVIWQQAAAWILCRLPLSLLHAHTYTHIHKPTGTSWFLLFFWWEGGLFVPFPPFHHVQPFDNTDVDDEVLLICGFLFSAPQSLWWYKIIPLPMIDIPLPCTVLFLHHFTPFLAKKIFVVNVGLRHFGHLTEDSLSWYGRQWLSYPVLTEKHVHSLGFLKGFWPPGRFKCDTSSFFALFLDSCGEISASSAA